MVKTYWLIALTIILGTGCQQKPPQQRQAVNQAFFKDGPKLVKIPITDAGIAEQLIRDSIEVIVVEPDYIIARLKQSQAETIQNLTLSMTPAQESEMTQRLIRVIVNKHADVQKLVDIGIDTWEVRGDTVLARAYDNYIRRIRKMGFTVTILEPNAADLLKKMQPKK